MSIRRCLPAALTTVLGLGLWAGLATPARAQNYTYAQNYAYYRYPMPQDYTVNRFWYYPYYYYPANYWPQTSPHWPERTGEHYMRPPAYMAFPPFREPHWRYEYWEPQTYHRGSHFWLDIF